MQQVLFIGREEDPEEDTFFLLNSSFHGLLEEKSTLRQIHQIKRLDHLIKKNRLFIQTNSITLWLNQILRVFT